MEITGLDSFFHWFWSSNQSTVLIGTTLGIIFKYFYDYSISYFRATDKSTVVFDRKGFLITIVLSGFLSLILFSSVLSKIVDLKSDFLVLSVALQNGFFWQTLIGDIGKGKACSNKKIQRTT
jgi:hypothetical protein